MTMPIPLDEGGDGRPLLPPTPQGLPALVDEMERRSDRVARYAAAIWGGHLLERGLHASEVRRARAVMEVADQEQADLRVEVERLRRQEKGQMRAAQSAWSNADRLRATLARLRALADEWDEAGEPSAEVLLAILAAPATAPSVHADGADGVAGTRVGSAPVEPVSGDERRPEAVESVDLLGALQASVERARQTCRRCGVSKRAARVGVLCDPPHAKSHDFPGGAR